jgi:dTDP-4-dehydrorhamnose reductase
MWTPVNEPLTTARFSGLYGHWYPHGRRTIPVPPGARQRVQGHARGDARDPKRHPDAQLVQTEDLGKCFSTAPLRYQANFENERRWLSLDLLCGASIPSTRCTGFLIGAGIGWDEIEAFAGGEAKPDLLGINHYLTSERFLDHRSTSIPATRSAGTAATPMSMPRRCG